MKAKITTAANIPAATRRAVYRRDGYRCALCDDVRGLQIHHAMPRSVGGSDDEMNLVTLCWRCHAEAHGTFLPERHRAPRTPEELAELRRSLKEAYAQNIVEYLADLYAEEGVIWPAGGAGPAHPAGSTGCRKAACTPERYRAPGAGVHRTKARGHRGTVREHRPAHVRTAGHPDEAGTHRPGVQAAGAAVCAAVKLWNISAGKAHNSCGTII